MYLPENKSKLLFRWLKKEKGYIYKIYALAALQGAVYLVIPLSVQGIITYTMAGKFSASLLFLSLATILATFFIGLLQLWQNRLNETIQQRLFAGVTDLFSRRQGLEPQEGLKKDLLYFFEVVIVQKGVGKLLLDFSFSIISIVFGLLILPAYSTWFLLFTVLLSVAFYLIVTFYGKRAQQANIEASNEKYKVYGQLCIDDDRKSVDVGLGDYLRTRTNYYTIVETQYRGILSFKVLFVSVLLLLGIYLVHIGELNIGQFVAAEIIILLVINSVEKLVSSLGTFYDITTGLYKIEKAGLSFGGHSFVSETSETQLKSAENVYHYNYNRKTKLIFYSIMVTGLVLLFMPWTQTVDAEGQVSVINPELKPQTVNTRIGGRIEKWYINDGAFVKKNDTIAFLSEVKEDYLDSRLVERSESQVKAKEVSIQSYESKLNAIDQQIDALNRMQILKLAQVKNKILQVRAKIGADSADAIAAANNYRVAEEQFKRYDELLQKGVISRTDYENRKVKLQEAGAKKIAAENKLTAAKNELTNTEIEFNGTQQEYAEKLMKTESEKFSTMSLLYDAEGSLTKLQNQYSNYSLRNTYYYVLAPQDGYISDLKVQGVGEIVKEGSVLCTIVPSEKEQVVELYVNPIDLPLIDKGQEISIFFDGWPSFVFSGWPGLSYGAFKAEIVSYDKMMASNGKFRVLAKRVGDEWPSALQIGSGARGFALLKEVPLVYELWRIANGFPPEYYKKSKTEGELKNEKK